MYIYIYIFGIIRQMRGGWVDVHICICRYVRTVCIRTYVSKYVKEVSK